MKYPILKKLRNFTNIIQTVPDSDNLDLQHWLLPLFRYLKTVFTRKQKNALILLKILATPWYCIISPMMCCENKFCTGEETVKPTLGSDYIFLAFRVKLNCPFYICTSFTTKTNVHVRWQTTSLDPCQCCKYACICTCHIHAILNCGW